MKTFMPFRKSGTVLFAVLVALFLVVLSGNQSQTSPTTQHAALSTHITDQGTITTPAHITPTGQMVSDYSPTDKLPVSPASKLLYGFLLFPGISRRPVQFKRRAGSGRGYTPGNVSDAAAAYSSNGAAKLTQRAFQDGLALKTRRVRLSLTAGANATPVFFDFLGYSTRTLTNITVGGTSTTNTESGLRNQMGTAPFMIGRVYVQVSVSTMWNTIALQFIKRTSDGQINQVPFDSFFIQNPMNTNTLYNITDPVNVLADGGFAMSASLLNGEVLTLGFEIPAIVNTYAMSQ